MKNSYIIIGVVAVLIIIAAIILGQQPAQQQTSGAVVNQSTIDQLHLGMNATSISQLKSIIKGNYDDYEREQAVFALADVATRTGNQEDAISFLKGVASDADENVSMAAENSIWFMRQKYPANISGGIGVAVDGVPAVGRNVTFILSVSSAQDANAVVGLKRWLKDENGARIMRGATLISHFPMKMELNAGETRQVPIIIQLDEPGDYEVVFEVKLDTDRFDYRTYETGGTLHVGADAGSYVPN